MKLITVFSFLIFSSLSFGQELSGEQLLEKAIRYHDPSGQWETFSGAFTVALETPDKPDRLSTITLNLPESHFKLSTVQDGNMMVREINGTVCIQSEADGTLLETTIDDERCNRTLMYRNYYSYLYGLPMKLKDPGTIVDPKVHPAMFKGKEYLVLKVSYAADVGSDVWQFYFDPETYAMEVYQFFKGSDVTTGEYILLSDEFVVNDIRMPKDRAWYYNKDNGYLGTDKLISSK